VVSDPVPSPADVDRLYATSPTDSAMRLKMVAGIASRYLGREHPRVEELRAEFRAARLIELIDQQDARGFAMLTPEGFERVVDRLRQSVADQSAR
jgi:hypothetical protein